MGADAFIAFYGIKITLDPGDDDDEYEYFEETDPRCLSARRIGLEIHFDRMTDGDDYFLYIGKRVAWIGLEHDTHASQTIEALSSIAANVDSKLRSAGFSESPRMHFQFIGQY